MDNFERKLNKDSEIESIFGGKSVPSKSKEEVEELRKKAKLEKIFEESEKERKEQLKKMEAFENKMKEESSLWDEIEEGSSKEILFNLIEKEFPELRLSTKKIPFKKSRPGLGNSVLIEVTPFETDKDLLKAILENPITKVITLSLGNKEEFANGLELEKNGHLPDGVTKGALARAYEHEIEMLEKENADKEAYKKLIREYERKIDKIEFPPLSNQEMRDLFRSVILEEMEKDPNEGMEGGD